MTEKSHAYKLVKHIWDYENLGSWIRLNHVLQDALSLAISADLNFNEDDISGIYKDFNGGYWFGANIGGKGYPSDGDSFYSQACSAKSTSAIKSFENFLNLKPFILDGKRIHTGFPMRDVSNRRIRVTGFDLEENRVMLVSYEPNDWKEEGKKKLHSYSNKEWLTVRKTLKAN